jgi:hypothetical protein
MEEQLNVETQQPLQPQPPQPPVPIPLPNATASLVLGILSIVSICCYVGLILGIIGLVLGNKAVELYQSSPGVYSKVAYQNAHAGKVCSIIGLSLSAIYVALQILFLAVFSSTIFQF